MVDIIYKYTAEEVRTLRKKGEIVENENFNSEESEEEQEDAFVFEDL